MGTNYKFIPNQDNPLHVYGEIHLGKSSHGWTFSFHGYDIKGERINVDVDRYSGLQVWVEVPTLIVKDYGMVIALINSGGVIENEYGCTYTSEEFCKLVEVKQRENSNHAKQFRDGSWIDSEGYSFSGYDFS